MKRRTELKLESMKIFSKKYIFSSRFIVRNTLAVLVIGTVVGGSAMTANLVDSNEVADNSIRISTVFDKKVSKNAAKTSKVSKKVEKEVAAPEKYVINISSEALIEDTSVEELYTEFADAGYLVAANKTNNLSKSEYDMTGKYIVKTDGLNLRENASEDAEVLGVLNTGDSGEVVGTDGEWTIVATNNGKGYVKTKYIITDDDATKIAKQAAMKGVSFKALLTIDEQQVIVAAANKDDSTAAPVEDSDNETTESFDEEDSTKTSTEATSEATTEEPTTEEPTTEETTEEPTTETPVVASSDLNLLAAIVYAEAGGEGYEGQLAVAAVIMNRLANGYWGSTLSDVIYAPGQFTGVYCDSFTYALSNPDPSCLSAASAAMGGATNLTGNYMYFLPTWAVDPSQGKQTIGNHVFW